MKTALILGGDGYLSWPTAMHLSAKGWKVAIADNYLRRRLARETDSEPLFDCPNMHERAERWHALSGHRIDVHVVDLAQREACDRLVRDVRPDTLVHYAEIGRAHV